MSHFPVGDPRIFPLLFLFKLCHTTFQCMAYGTMHVEYYSDFKHTDRQVSIYHIGIWWQLRCRRKMNLSNVCELPIRHLKQGCFWDVQGSFGWVIKIALWKCGSLSRQNICVRVVTSLELCGTCQRVSHAEKPGTICLPESLPSLSLHYTPLATFTL